MDEKETRQLLIKASALDNRLVTNMSVKAWHDVVRGLDYGVAVAALDEHYRTSEAYLMPTHVLRLAESLTEIPRVNVTAERHAVERAAFLARHQLTEAQFEARRHDTVWVQSLLAADRQVES